MSGTAKVPDIVLVERRGQIAVVTLNRPRVRNAVNDELRAALTAAVEEVVDDREVAVVVLTGAGSAFCAGGDIAAMKARLEAPGGRVAIDGWRRQHRTAALVGAIARAGKVTIAAVNGPAAGLGLDLALACDFIVADPVATFASSFVRRGLIPDGGSLFFLPRRIGLQQAKRMLYSGRSVAADEALDLGLVDRVAGESGALADALAFAAEFTRSAGPAISLMKSIVDRSLELSLAEVAALGGEAQAICYTTDEHRAAVEAFLAR